MTENLLAVRRRIDAPSSTPDDTRYPVPAIAAGVIGGAAAAAGLAWLAPLGDALAWMIPTIGVVAGGLIAASIKVADQWEKAVVLRLGKYRGLRGPGVFFVIPVVDRVSYHIDQCIRTITGSVTPNTATSTIPMASTWVPKYPSTPSRIAIDIISRGQRPP